MFDAESDYPVPAGEEQRLQSLHAHRLLGAPEKYTFRHIVVFVSELLQVEFAGISLVDRDRVWFTSRVGSGEEDVPRRLAFCSHAICEDLPMLVPDLLQDDRFKGNPYVSGEVNGVRPNMRFYAGYPLRGKQGHAIGVLYAIDTKPRFLSNSESKLLASLAELVVEELDALLDSALLASEAGTPTGDCVGSVH